MSLTYEQKKAVVAEVAEVAAGAHSLVAAEYSGLTVEQLTELRRESRNAGVYLRVVKNTLARRAFDGTEFACVSDQLVGPLILAFSQADPGAAARVIKDYSKKSDKLVVKLVSIGGQSLPASDLERLASLPSREEALSMLLGVMKAPIEKFVRTLAEPHAKMVRTVAAVRDQKQAA
ncbi:MAG: 50S ribosomal protein L10 [Gammaproteobacteria bacterium]|nr:50S ribosomal protein L10 [Gammaproteobacteria bacterium]